MIEVLPNGMLVIEAARQVEFSQQTQTIVLRGLVRPEDISQQNQVLSTAISSLELEVRGKGIINDYTHRQNPLVRLHPESAGVLMRHSALIPRHLCRRTDAATRIEAAAICGTLCCCWPSLVARWLLVIGRSAVRGRGRSPHRRRSAQARVKDISSIEGIRDNQLVGYGLVVGLQGTGDSQQTTFPTQTLAAMLLRMGVSVPASAIRVQNLAAVFVSATLPPFARPGTKLDITASSAGDARSLEGGLLLMTPLYGTDGKIYAQAQGPLVVGGYSVSVNGNTQAVQPSDDGADSVWRDGGAGRAAGDSRDADQFSSC